MKRLIDKAGWALAGALGLALLLVAARSIAAGPLDPPGPVASTLRSLSDMVPSWSRTLPASSGCASARFSCVMGGAAVLDYETGLVWEKTPLNGSPTTWANAAAVCTSLQTGGRFGWRLPTANELLSLKDPSNFPDALPTGHPFTGTGNNPFWSSTTDPLDNARARWISFVGLASNEQSALKTANTLAGAWCVRGGVGFDTPPAEDPASWSRTLPTDDGIDSCNSSRFTCVMSNAGVLDHETGLVWQRDPTVNAKDDWPFVAATCYALNVGGRRGWRLATVAEVSSLLDVSIVGPAISLPTGHPFLNVDAPNSAFWTATESTGFVGFAYAVLFKGLTGLPGSFSQIGETGTAIRPWCVRGAVTK
jgi:hypothetical protein